MRITIRYETNDEGYIELIQRRPPYELLIPLLAKKLRLDSDEEATLTIEASGK